MQKCTNSKSYTDWFLLFQKVRKLSFFLFILVAFMLPMKGEAFFDYVIDCDTILEATKKNRIENVKRLLQKVSIGIEISVPPSGESTVVFIFLFKQK